MPLKPIDYSNTIFYRIVCNDLNIKDCYIGHTTNFIKRKQSHKTSCNNEKSKKYNYKVYQFIRENGGWDNWTMVMIEQISCENFNDACKLERKFLEEYKATLNMVISYREEKEYIKEYYNKNINKIKEYNKEFYQKNKNKIKEYQELNKDVINEKKKEYQKLTIYCDCCKKDINKATKAKHYKTNSHIKNLSII